MVRAFSIVCSFMVVGFSLAPSVTADVILNSITGSVSASIDLGPANTGTTILAVGSVSRTFTGTDNNFTTSSESQNWNALTKSLTGSGLITEAKTLAAKPGGVHNGISTLSFVFTNTASTSLSLSGTWGFVNNTASLPDSISWTLIGPLTNLSQNAAAGGGGSQPFSTTTPLGVGIFTLTISANFNETINNVATRTANWNLTNFNFASVPEANPLPLFGLCGALLLATMLVRRKGFRGRRWSIV